jgi:hypothetical protein
MRAGDHIAHNYQPITNQEDGASHVYLKLWHSLPTDAKDPVTRYIKGFAKDNGCKVARVKHSKFMIEFWVDDEE